MEKKEIKVNTRAYEWSSATGAPAPWPEHDAKQINEQSIPHEERFKECFAVIDDPENGTVEWLTQDSDCPSDEFNDEIIRAFKANGFTGTIHVSYGCRDNGLTEHYDLKCD